MIEEVELKNWKSHHETRMEFSGGVNALVGTMGSGKSSVLEAVVFALYGTTPKLNSRELKLDDVIRRSPDPADEAEVRVDFTVEGKNYSVSRRIERGSGTERSELREDGELVEAPSTQEVTEQVEKVLGMDFKSFTRAVYSEQNHLDLFLEMRPGDRKERIDELLELDRFEDARKTAVKVENRLEDQYESRQQELEELEEELEDAEGKKLEQEVEEAEQELEELEEELDELEERLESEQEKREELEQRKERFEELDQKKTRLETRRETVEERLEEKLEAVEEIGDAEKRLEEARDKVERLEEMHDRIAELEKELEHLEEREEELQETEEQLEEQLEKYGKREEVEEELEQVKQELEEVKKSGNQSHARRKELEESVEKLRDAEVCPTCGEELEKGHREQLLEERKTEIRELRKREKKLREKLKELKERRDRLEEERDELLQYSSAGDELEEVEQKLDHIQDEKKGKKEELDQLHEDYSEERVEELEEEIEKLEQVEEIRELEDKLGDIEEKESETREALEELDFSPDELEEAREKVSDLEKEVSVKRSRIDSLQELLEEKRKRLEQLNRQRDKKEEIERELERLDRMLDYAHSYGEALNTTQVSLRELFVERLNELMADIWEHVYPYDDYYSIRLNAEEGYLLELLDSDDSWISAEAEVSGGERHSAALVMRLALTFALSPRLQVLMLDEPTHNLDSSAVEELARTLGDRTRDLVDQLFVVTHDPALEASATGKLYRFEKKGTEAGLTEVEEVE